MEGASGKFRGTSQVQPAHKFDVVALEKYLQANSDRIKTIEAVEEFNGGQSNPTYLLYTDSERLVLRRQPPGTTLQSAHAVDREFRITSALSDTEVPVSRPLLLCEDPNVIGTSFYLMEHLDGRVFWDPLLPDVTREERRHIYDAMNRGLAALHNLEPSALGLGDFGKPGGYIARQISRWTSQYQHSGVEPDPTMEKLIAWMAGHFPTLEDMTTLIHGDYRLDNMIFHPVESRILGVIDWELATLGNPIADLSYQCMQWRLPKGIFGGLKGVDRVTEGLPSEEEYVSQYCECTGRNGIDNWEYYIVYNMFRFAAILFGVQGRVKAGNAANDSAVEMGKFAKPVAEEAWSLARSLGG